MDDKLILLLSLITGFMPVIGQAIMSILYMVMWTNPDYVLFFFSQMRT
ncbi:hypothetical protein [Paenibacillus glucanolyticus]|nr:hypothetical protein [Paenibacillus glucanolyticus]